MPTTADTPVPWRGTPPARRLAFVTVAAAVLVASAGCGDDGASSVTTSSTAATPGADEPVIDVPDGVDQPSLDPADVVAVIDNPYLPFRAGERWVYEGESDGELERIEVTVLPERREVMGIPATVVRDTVTVDGELVEDTYDWFAQDRDGNVWYLGEDSKEYEDGEVVSTAGSWEAGVDGALPGIVMEAAPAVGDAYRQELYEGEAEDLAEVVREGVTEEVAAGTYDELLVIEEWNPLEPEVVEEKYYARGVGMVLEVTTRGGDSRIELIEHTGPG
jgi:hypothetical protein